MARISTRHLARLCHNLGTGIHAGLDVRRIWESESQRGPIRARQYFEDVRHEISQGNSLASAFRSARGYFPPLFCEMVEVGERTGRLERVFQRLAEHYDQVLVLRRNFLIGIAWPMIELGLGVFVIGIFIWILGTLTSGSDRPLSVLGLSGFSGAMIWYGTFALIAAAIGLPMWGVQKGWLDPGPFFRLLLHVPGLGSGLRTISMSRLTWALAMATDSDLPPDKAIELALRSTQNSYYTDMIDQMRLTIRRGGEMHEAFRITGRFPDDFIETVETGELSGRVSETLEILSRDYDGRAKMWYRGLALFCGLSIFLAVAAFMIFMIFQIVQIYLTPINDALKDLS